MTSTPQPDEDVTVWIRRIEAGDREATADLWQYCVPELLRYCRGKLPSHLRQALDEEDVALSAIQSFCGRAERSELGEIADRNSLWRLLYTIASRKAASSVRYQTRQKRGGGAQYSLDAPYSPDVGADDSSFPIQDPVDSNADPATLAEFADDCRRWMDLLDDDNLRAVAMLRIEGYSVIEIAERMGCAKRSVERRLNLVRTIWRTESGDGDV